METLLNYASRKPLVLFIRDDGSFAVLDKEANFVYSVIYSPRGDSFETWDFTPRLEGGRGVTTRRNAESVKRSLRRLARRYG